MLQLIEQGAFAGLQPLTGATFPKRCVGCGRIYADAHEFITSTLAIMANKTGLRQSAGEADTPLVELLRICRCGSTLMERFLDRRDHTANGIGRRRHFEVLLASMKSRTLAREIADMQLQVPLPNRKTSAG